MEENDEDQVKHDIEQRGKDQEVQGHPAVPKRPQYTCQQIIKHLRKDARADDHDIGIGVPEDILRRVHQFQPRLHKEHERRREDRAYDQGQYRCPCHGLPHCVHVPRTEFLRSEDRKSCGHPYDKTIDQKHDRTGASHGGKRSRAYELPHDHRVRHIVKLLKDISQKDGKRKTQNDLHRTSRCHVLLYCFHLSIPLMLCYTVCFHPVKRDMPLL